MKLSLINQKVLDVLREESGDFGFLNFDRLSSETGFDRKAVRRACRFLARKGLAVYGKGLWTEDGEPAGSGYAAASPESVNQ